MAEGLRVLHGPLHNEVHRVCVSAMGKGNTDNYDGDSQVGRKDPSKQEVSRGIGNKEAASYTEPTRLSLNEMFTELRDRSLIFN